MRERGREGRGREGMGAEGKGRGARPVCLLVFTILAAGLNVILWICFWGKQVVGGRAPRYTPPLSSLCGCQSAWRRRTHRNVAVVSHAQYVPTLTAVAAWRVKAVVSKAAWWPWPLTFWPWKWCPSHVWRGLPLCQFWSSWASLFST